MSKKDIYILEFANECYTINLKEINLYSIIKTNFDMNTSNLCSVNINNKIYNFDIIKKGNINSPYYHLSFLNKSYDIFNPKDFIFKKNNFKNIHTIYCYEHLIKLLQNYNYSLPYINHKFTKIKINFNMKEKEKENLLSIITQDLKHNIIYEDDLVTNYIITEEEFTEIANNLILNISDNLNEDTFLPQKFGKYFNEYFKINNYSNRLIFHNNINFRSFTNDVIYEKILQKNIIFISGPNKIGKTFSLLYATRLHCNNIYINIKKLYEIEEKKNLSKVNEIFFYEIARGFKNYKDYKIVIENIIKDYKKLNNNNLTFIDILFIFIEGVEKFAVDKDNNYNELMIILDEFELDENSKEIFDKNYELINKIYNKKYKFNIQFSIISPINNNYIKKCIIVGLKLMNEACDNFQKDNRTGKIYYAYYYYCNLFYSNDNEFNSFKKIINNKNENNKKIPGKYLELFNYSLYYFNMMNSIDDTAKFTNKFNLIEKFIKEQKNEAIQLTYSFYEDINKTYKYNLEKIKKYNDLINKEINLNTLLDMLLFFPIELLCVQYIYFDTYKVTFLYKIYEDCISNYLNTFDSPDFYENKQLKPGEKGDIFERKVINVIKNGYFRNFRPDYNIEVLNILNISKKKYNKSEISKFKEIEKYNLIIITQRQTNAARYDVAFLQKIRKNEFKFILCQITKGKKKSKQMEQYKSVREDCIKFSDFFSLINISVIYNHFFFVFHGGLGEDENAMNYCQNNNIFFIKFLYSNRNPLFSNANNYIIDDLIFNDKSFSLVELIKNERKKIIIDISDSSEYSVLGIKRQTVSKNSKAIYCFGKTIYNAVKAIIKKDYKLSDEYYTLEENKYFYIYYKYLKNENKKLYYLAYILNGKKIIINLENIKDDNSNLASKIEEPGFKFKCFEIVDNKKRKFD